MRTTHDEQMARYSQNFVEPNPDARGSSGYVGTDGKYQHANDQPEKLSEADELARRLAITERQLAAVTAALAGKSQEEVSGAFVQSPN